MLFRSADTTPPRKRPRRRLASRLADEAFEYYLAWRSECAVLEAAYRRWRQAPRPDAAFAYAAYMAALEREECAAGRYRAVVVQAEDLFGQAA